MSVTPQETLDDQVKWMITHLELAEDVLREGLKRGKLSLVKQRYLLHKIADARNVVYELRGAMEAYRSCAFNGWTVASSAQVEPEDKRLEVAVANK